MWVREKETPWELMVTSDLSLPSLSVHVTALPPPPPRNRPSFHLMLLHPPLDVARDGGEIQMGPRAQQ